MPRNPSGQYNLPAGVIVSAGEVIQPSQHNPALQDIAQDLNDPRPIASGGTGATSATAARANLGATVTGDAVFVAADQAAGRTALGLGTIATQAANNVTITGGTITTTGILTVEMDNARLNLYDTTGTANTHAIAGFAYNNSVLSSLVRTNTGDFVAFGWQTTFNASGPVSYSFPVGVTERLSVTGGGATVTGAFIVTGGASFGGTSTCHSFHPAADNTYDLGNLVSGAYWRVIYLRNAPVVSSDARLKENIADLTDAERRAAAKIKPRTFTMNGRKKVGYVAQEIEAAMASEGLDAVEYGLVTIGGDDMRGVDYDAIAAFRLGALT